MIRLADRHGWGVMDKYTADNLADNSNDEKRIEWEEKAAERRAEKQWRKHGQVPEKLPGGSQCFSPAAQAQVMGMHVSVVPVSLPRRQVCTYWHQARWAKPLLWRDGPPAPSLPGQGSSNWSKATFTRKHFR